MNEKMKHNKMRSDNGESEQYARIRAQLLSKSVDRSVKFPVARSLQC